MVKNVDAAGLRIARLAYVMHYSLGTQACSHKGDCTHAYARALEKSPTRA
jgi:hypothetical protein